MRQLKCPACGDTFAAQLHLSAHILVKHPKFRYKCQFCTKKYLGHASLSKHEKLYRIGRFTCKACQKNFHFPQPYNDHLKTHTRKNLIPHMHCKKKFPSNQNMQLRAVTHSGQIHKCTICKFVTNTYSNLAQNICGEHGRGCMATCGKCFKWTPTMHHHKKKCTKC